MPILPSYLEVIVKTNDGTCDLLVQTVTLKGKGSKTQKNNNVYLQEENHILHQNNNYIKYTNILKIKYQFFTQDQKFIYFFSNTTRF